MLQEWRGIMQNVNMALDHCTFVIFSERVWVSIADKETRNTWNLKDLRT